MSYAILYAYSYYMMQSGNTHGFHGMMNIVRYTRFTCHFYSNTYVYQTDIRVSKSVVLFFLPVSSSNTHIHIDVHARARPPLLRKVYRIITWSSSTELVSRPGDGTEEERPNGRNIGFSDINGKSV